MKGITSLKRMNEAVATGGNISNDVDRVFDRIMKNNSKTPMPDVVVNDNPKAKKYAEIIMHQLNKRCGWSCYYASTFLNINGNKSILLFDDNSAKAVGFAPTSSENNATFYYYGNYNIDGKNTADFVVDSGRYGIVQSLSIIADYIKNPSMYKSGINESMVAEAGNNEYSEFYNMLLNGASDDKVREHNRFMSGKDDTNIRRMTREGVLALEEKIKKENLDVVEVLRAMLAKEGSQYYDLGVEYRRLLGDTLAGTPEERGKRRPGPERYIAFLQKFLNDAGGKMQVNVEATPEDTQEVQSEELIYGFAPSYLKLLGINISEFKESVRLYEEGLKIMRIYLPEFIDYARASRAEKLSREFQDVPSALFISGNGGVGKTYTWNQVKKEKRAVKGKDYADMGTGSTAVREIYKFIYENNGKVLVFDDSGSIFNSEYSGTIWKTAFDKPENSFPELTVSVATSDTYEIDKCKVSGVPSSRVRYEKECPREFVKNAKTAGMTPQEIAQAEAESKKVYMPDKTNVMSKFLFITNLTQPAIERAMGDHWDAVKSRITFIRLAPPPLVVWEKIKRKITEQMQNDDPDAWIPKSHVEEVIKYVEQLLREGNADQMSIRPFSKGSIRGAIKRGLDWKFILRSAVSSKDADSNV